MDDDDDGSEAASSMSDEDKEESGYEEEDENNDEEWKSNGLVSSDDKSELHQLALKLSGNFSIAPIQRTNWSKMVYEENAEEAKDAKKQTKAFGGGLFHISEDYLNAKNKSLLKNQVTHEG